MGELSLDLLKGRADALAHSHNQRLAETFLTSAQTFGACKFEGSVTTDIFGGQQNLAYSSRRFFKLACKEYVYEANQSL
jgi:hypothetical protein